MNQSSMSELPEGRYALIAGNGRFPFLVLEAARTSGRPMLVAAIRQEADPDLERLAAGFHWIGLGELSRLIDLLKSQGISSRRHGRPGEAHANLLLHPPGLAAAEAAGIALKEEHRRAAGRRGRSASPGRNYVAGLHYVPEAVAGRRRRAEPPGPGYRGVCQY